MLGLGRRAARAADASVLALGVLMPCVAAAHGEPPTAHAVIRADSSGPILIKLGTGFALRQTGGRFRFVCPALWGGELTAPAAALPDGRVVLGANVGLMLLATDGSITPHPDPLALGLSTELVRSQDKVFALRYSAGRSEVLLVDAEHVRVVWSDSNAWYSLAALRDSLVLLRASNANVEQLALSFDGVERERRSGNALRTVDYAFVRPLDDEAYALLLFQTTPELGRLEQGSFVRVAQAGSVIAGPIATPEGPLLALDGQLNRMQGQTLSPVAGAAYVSCLEHGEFANYACTRSGLGRVGPTGVGEELFGLRSLVPPDLTLVHDEKARARCDYQWQDMRFDLIALGMPLRFEGQDEPDAALPDAGVVTEAEAGGPTPDEGNHPAPDAGEEPSARAKGSSHCALSGARQRRDVSWSVLAWLGLFGGVLRRLGGRRRR